MGALLLTACTKEVDSKSIAFVNVKFIDKEEYDLIDNITGTWNSTDRIASLDATGLRLERFILHLENINDTGDYSNLFIENFYYSDGLDFQPFYLKTGVIHISYFDSQKLTGEFLVLLEDNYNGAESKWVVGNFGIIQSQP